MSNMYYNINIDPSQGGASPCIVMAANAGAAVVLFMLSEWSEGIMDDLIVTPASPEDLVDPETIKITMAQED